MEKKDFQSKMDWRSQQSNCSSDRLENIEEENPTGWFPMTTLPPPETPTESMEFLARSWSLSSLQLSKALRDTFLQSHSHAFMETAPRSLGMEVPNKSATSTFQHAKISTHSGGGVPPNSVPTMGTEDMKVCKSMVKGKSVGKWLKDHKAKKKEEIRTHNAQLHAATSVAGLAAAVAAIVAATSMSPDTQAALEDRRSSVAVASAAALVASHCFEIAEEMGANRDQILMAITSAVNIKTTGDIMTLTAGAATALRGAAALKARFLHKEIIPPSLVLDAKAPEDMHAESCTALNFVTRGGELLKRTRKGVLHWKQVSFYMNSNGQVIIEMKSKHIARTFVKKKKSIVFDLCCDVPAWNGRNGEDGQQKTYFGIQTADRLIEFECSDKHKQMWIDGIQHMLQYRGKSEDSLSM